MAKKHSLDKRVEKFLDREFDKTKEELTYIQSRDWSDTPIKGAAMRYELHRQVIKRSLLNLKEIKELTSSDFSNSKVKEYIETCLRFSELASEWYTRRSEIRAWTDMDDNPKEQAEEFKFQGDIHEQIKANERELDKLELSSTITVTLNLHKSTEFVPFALIFKYYRDKTRIGEMLRDKLDKESIQYIESVKN